VDERDGDRPDRSHGDGSNGGDGRRDDRRLPPRVTVGPAREGERATALSIVDMAGLQVDREAVMSGERDVLVAVAEGRVLGALVLDGHEIEAVAVRPGRQAQGIGSALVETAAANRGGLVAEFDAALREFYEGLGFEVERIAESRCRGVRE
jgi:ribosomal protein S18 acetylase RimI-like enzyme